MKIFLIQLFIISLFIFQQSHQQSCTYDQLSLCIEKWTNAIYPDQYNNTLFRCQPYAACSDSYGCRPGKFANTTFTTLGELPGDALTLALHVCLSAGKYRSSNQGCHMQSCSQIGYYEDVYGKQCNKFPFDENSVSKELLFSDQELQYYRGWFRRSSINTWFKYYGGSFSPDACLGMQCFFAAPSVKDKEINEKMKEKMSSWLKQAKQGTHYYKINIDQISPILNENKDIYQKIDYSIIEGLPEGVKKFSDKNHNSHKLQYLQTMFNGCDCDDEFFIHDNSLHILGYTNCPDHNFEQWQLCLLRPNHLGMIYLLFKMRGLKPTCSMKFWKMIGVNSQIVLEVESQSNKGSSLHLLASEIFLRILLKNRGMKIKFEHAKKVIYKRQVKLDSNKQGTNATNPLFKYMMYYNKQEKYEEISKDLVEKCSRVNIDDYKSKNNIGNEWSWRRPGWDPNVESPPWYRSFGIDWIALAQYLLNPDWYKT